MRTEKCGVLVVGAGPSGLAASALLAGYGIAVIGISKYGACAPTPRATVANARSMEVYRDLGIEDEMKTQGVSMRSLPFNVFATSMDGMEFARYRSYGTSAARLSDYAAASPCVGWNIAQHRLEPVLLAGAKSKGADIRYSNEMLSIEQHTDGVVAAIRNRETGEEYRIEAAFAIGADGGRSTVAEQCGFEMEGAPTEKGLVSMWVEADLAKYAAHRPAYLYNIFRPGPHQWYGAGSWLCVTPYSEWLFSMAGTADVGEAELLKRARETIGDPDVAIKINQIYDWRVNHIYARQYRKGRIFLAGDAAHRHPPAGGLGANTSVQDAFNLAWKLAHVLKGYAGEALLDTYHDERQPVGRHLVERANKSMANNAPIPAAVGWTDEMPENEAWQKLETLFSDTAEAAERRAKLDAAIALGNYRSNAIGMELGQRYRSSAIHDDGLPMPSPSRDPELYYEPTSFPGAYLPHAWVQHGAAEVSTLDIVGKGSFCLLVGLGGKAWAEAAEAVTRETGVPLTVRTIGKGCEFDDLTGEWAAVREVSDHGALLVRPDRWVAWRSTDLPPDAVAGLTDAVRHVLSLA
ncbi:FAD-dependent monooxygenase [Sphingopyxis sp.]|uniref:FAD-dependent monooxygenase n=1 Tax=Sphingopyxis sp. TaxID=1908224 RepID=UPI002B4973EC|nr:FAD-dependent monooxygenase [Sphingopyxis sp.]HJS09762.1 FAD-dependent monooxygenase [Sphingopyxis sp.]